eukprot:CAMPEP_0197876940 /NCGR_PEP_ID=MMETSP1439-20131203/5787_1 /TAXON_ID=66791 /ORGANISM="Gonyaulax spinifera, Strain CCMP409" /LENGTH=124 /DNA_ID=CAMNT_0043496251 /DNA_START=67 /DNA_END=438 /DNA_ORIENTATION=-
MAARVARVAAAAAVGSAAVLSWGPAFLPGVAGPTTGAASPALRQQAGRQTPSSKQSLCLTAAAAATTVAVGAGLRRRRANAVGSRTAQQGSRRDLAIAYEDSGISLIDNGKFSQGLVGAEGAWG